MYKICNRCKKQKLLGDFSRRTASKDGLQPVCRVCVREYDQTNKDRFAIQREKYYEANKYKTVAYYEANKERILARQIVYREVNKEQITAYHEAYREINKDKIADYQLAYRKANPDKINTRTAKRRATKLQATPLWLTEDEHEQIESFYTEAKKLESTTGQKYHVDHIVPLQGKTVCGLHVPWNLQVITATDNIRKYNKLSDLLGEQQW